MLKDNAIRYGFGTGVAVIGYFLLFYVISKSLMLNAGVFMASTILFVVGMILACRQERSDRGDDGYPIRDSLKTAFAVYVVAATMYHIWNYFMLSQIDPSLVGMQQEMIMERLEQNAGLFGEEATEQIKDSYRERGIEVTVSTTFFSMARSVLLGFVLALPIAYSYRTVSVNQN